MKRPLLVFAALAAFTATSMAPPSALARDGDRGGERGGRAERSDRDRGDRDRSDRDRREGGRRERSDDSRRWVDQDDGRRARIPALGYGDERRERPPPARRDDEVRARGFAPPPSSARRGGYLPDSYRGAVVDDFRRHRLRPPPQGYAWVRVGGGFALVSLADGRVFDMVD